MITITAMGWNTARKIVEPISAALPEIPVVRSAVKLMIPV
jgi:hypothetical protein